MDNKDTKQGGELGRYVLARMRRFLRAALPDVRGVVAYCDPIERRDEAGTEVGKRYALERLKAHQAPGRRSGEAGAAYVRRLQDEGWLRPVRHPRNHVFTWAE